MPPEVAAVGSALHELDVTLATLHAQHQRRMVDILFACGSLDGSLPAWLQERCNQLERNYAGINTTAEFSSAIASMKATRQKPIEVFVVGEGNFGKSTLLNALVGAKLSPVHFLPETRCFLRFVPSLDPSPDARLYVRSCGKMHRWLLRQLPSAKPCQEIFDTLTASLPVEQAESLLREEAGRCRKDPGYEPAIIEFEREVAITRNTLLPHQVRLVDTQGLNQIFPEEFEALAKRIDSATTAERLEEWFRSTSRGNHLDWQLRRCDVLLWVGHARKSTSAVTRVALQHFRRYGKPTVLAVTNIDRVEGGEDARARVLKTVAQDVAGHVDRIVAVNAKAAMTASLHGDQDALEASGILELVEWVVRRAVHEGARTRACSTYLSMRLTEQQLRSALHMLRGEVRGELEHEQRDRQQVKSSQWLAIRRLKAAVEQIRQEEIQQLANRLKTLGYTASEDAVISAVGAKAISRRIQAKIQISLDSSEAHLRALVDDISSKPYMLPSTDSEGGRSGDSVRSKVTAEIGKLRLPEMVIHLDLPSEFIRQIKEAWEWIWTWGEKWEREKKRKAEQLQSEVKVAVEPEINAHLEEALTVTLDACERAHRSVQGELDRVMERLCMTEDKPLEQTVGALDRCLGRVAFPAVVPHMVVTAMGAHSGDKRSPA